MPEEQKPAVTSCPHCGAIIFDSKSPLPPLRHKGIEELRLFATQCPACQGLVVRYEQLAVKHLGGGSETLTPMTNGLLWPKKRCSRPVPTEVSDKDIAADFIESCLVLDDSPKASAALSRRCLQHIIRKKLGIKKRTLHDEIEEVISAGRVPSDIADSLKAIKEIGNLAAHPTMLENTGEIVDVEAHEAEWNLEVIEALFDHIYVRPAKLQARKDAFNKKLQAAGKQPVS